MTFDAYYADAPADQRGMLKTFRQSHPAQQTTVDDVMWTYYTGGSSDDVILWLVGALRAADAAYRSIPLLEDAFRIVAPDYPPLGSMEALADGLAGVLDAAQVEKAHILAGSFGGMLAQVFMRRHPQRVNKVILSTTVAPIRESAVGYEQQLTMIRDVDEPIVREAAKNQFMQILMPPDDEKDFWRAYLDELFSERVGKADILCTFQAMIGFHQNAGFQAEDFADWQNRLLIIDADDDATFGAETQSILKALYPSAKTYTFTGSGHSPASTRRSEYFQLVREFLTD